MSKQYVRQTSCWPDEVAATVEAIRERERERQSVAGLRIEGITVWPIAYSSLVHVIVVLAGE